MKTSVFFFLGYLLCVSATPQLPPFNIASLLAPASGFANLIKNGAESFGSILKLPVSGLGVGNHGGGGGDKKDGETPIMKIIDPFHILSKGFDAKGDTDFKIEATSNGKKDKNLLLRLLPEGKSELEIKTNLDVDKAGKKPEGAKSSTSGPTTTPEATTTPAPTTTEKPSTTEAYTTSPKQTTGSDAGKPPSPKGRAALDAGTGQASNSGDATDQPYNYSQYYYPQAGGQSNRQLYILPVTS